MSREERNKSHLDRLAARNVALEKRGLRVKPDPDTTKEVKKAQALEKHKVATAVATAPTPEPARETFVQKVTKKVTRKVKPKTEK